MAALDGTPEAERVGVRRGGAGTTTGPPLLLTGLISSARGGPDRLLGDAVERAVTGYTGLKASARGGGGSG